MAIANLAMATGNIGRPGVGVNPLRGQNNVQGSCDMGSFPHELSATATSPTPRPAQLFEARVELHPRPRAGPAHPEHARRRRRGRPSARSTSRARTSSSPTPTPQHVSAGLAAMECVVVQDLFLNETANYAHVFLPGSTFLEKDGTFTNAERRIQPRAQGDGAEERLRRLGGDPADRARASGSTGTTAIPREIMDEIARLTPTFAGVTYEKLDAEGSIQWPCNDGAPARLPGDAHRGVHPRQGPLHADRVRPDRREGRPALPADPDHGAHPQPVQRRRPDPAHRQRPLAHRGPPGDPPARRRAARHPRRRLGHGAEPRRRDRRCAR